ncbi:MAG: DUF4367 domain-containing protein [Lachnospiraceae bacterium]|nr:DUF4367 domain-containing protein [Lachnospiraceae bacterium]
MTDELLNQMIREAFELEFEEIERRIMKEDPHIFSEEFEQKMDQITEQPGYEDWESLESERHFHFRFRYILAAVLLLVLATSTVMGNDLIKEQMKRIAYTVFPEYVRIEKKEDTMSTNTQSYVFEKPSYIPEGYHMIDEGKAQELGHYTIMWSNDDGKTISYTQAEISCTVMQVSSNGKKPKDVKIGDVTGKLGEDDNGQHSLFFEKGEKIFTIIGPVSEKEMMKIAESIE